MHWKGGRCPPPPLQGAQRMPSHRPPDAKCQLQWHLQPTVTRPQPLWQPPPTACLTASGAASEAPPLLMHPCCRGCQLCQCHRWRLHSGTPQSRCSCVRAGRVAGQFKHCCFESPEGWPEFNPPSFTLQITTISFFNLKLQNCLPAPTTWGHAGNAPKGADAVDGRSRKPRKRGFPAPGTFLVALFLPNDMFAACQCAFHGPDRAP